MADDGKRRKSVFRKTAREESPPREEIAMPESTPALVSSGFKRRQALKAVQEAAASAKEEDKDNKRRRITDESHLPKAHEAKPVVGDGNKRKERDSIMPQPAKAANKASSKEAEESKEMQQRDTKMRRPTTPRAAKASRDLKDATGQERKEAKDAAGEEERKSSKPKTAKEAKAPEEPKPKEPKASEGAGPRKSRREETKEERKERKEKEKEREARTAAKEPQHDRGSSKKKDKGESMRVESSEPAATQHKPYTAEGQGDGNASRAAAARVTEGKGKSVAVAEEREPVREDKGKGKAAMYEEEEEYEALSQANKLALHTEIAAELPEAKRLQNLLELAVEAESKMVRQHFTGRRAMVAQVFEEAMSRFIVESEGIAIAKLKRSANRGGAAAKMKPNPLNESKTREEAQLRDALRRFQAEEGQWEGVLAAAPLAGGGASVKPSYAALMHAEMSIAHRNMLSSSTGAESELAELLAWAHGYVHSGLAKPRSALAGIEDRSKALDVEHAKLVTSMRAAVRAPFAAAPGSAKELLRAVAAS